MIAILKWILKWLFSLSFPCLSCTFSSWRRRRVARFLFFFLDKSTIFPLSLICYKLSAIVANFSGPNSSLFFLEIPDYFVSASLLLINGFTDERRTFLGYYGVIWRLFGKKVKIKRILFWSLLFKFLGNRPDLILFLHEKVKYLNSFKVKVTLMLLFLIKRRKSMIFFGLESGLIKVIWMRLVILLK